MALSRSWDRGSGPRALLACAEGELHDLPLLGFGLCLREQGWRISYLGADTPVASVVEAAQALAPGRRRDLRHHLRRVRRQRNSAQGGGAPCSAVGRGCGGERAGRPHHAIGHPVGDVVLAAETLAAGVD